MLELRVERNEDGSAAEPIERDLTAEEIAALFGALDHAKAERLADLAAERWARTQTFSYDGVDAVPADSALVAVVGVVVGAQVVTPVEPITWKLRDGEFRSWSVEQITDYGIAIRAHIQACFDNERALTAAIQAAATHEDLQAINLAVGWPS